MVDGAVRLLWPPVCLVCGRAGDRRDNCCRGCHAALPVPAGRCRRCAAVLERDLESCGACLSRAPAFDAAWSAFEYAPPIASLVQRFKFSGDLAAGRLLAELMAERLVAQRADRPQLMVPVPLNWRREWRRGFNQARHLCRDLSHHLGGLPWTAALRRVRPTAAQSDLPADRRGGNVRGAFGARGIPRGARHLVLVDDVMTTGSTLEECARVLKRAGAARVDAWVVARA